MVPLPLERELVAGGLTLCRAGRPWQLEGAATTTFAADAENVVVVVRAVPADGCEVCGESFIDDDVAAALESLAAEARSSGTESIVLHYQLMPVAS